MEPQPPPTNFRGLFATLADPYAANLGGLCHAFRVEAAVTPALCYGMVGQGDYPVAYLGCRAPTGRPLIGVAAFDAALPGMPQPCKYINCGDLTPAGAYPPLMELHR